MNRSSSQGSRNLTRSLHGHREASLTSLTSLTSTSSFRGSYGGGDLKTEETAQEVSEDKDEKAEPSRVREERWEGKTTSGMIL